MSLNNTPSSNRVHIGLFGRRNSGKSSLLNAITGQSFSIVSDIKGTTTDPVQKSMELLPLGPIILIDTPGLDDTDTLGALRVQKTYQMLNKTDLALLVIDATVGICQEDNVILEKIKQKNIPYIIVFNKCDLICPCQKMPGSISISTKTGENIEQLKDLIATTGASSIITTPLIHDLFKPKDIIILVIPIDSSAPKGRLILPQQQTLREILDYQGIAITTTPETLDQTLMSLRESPSLVVTDSQAFKTVAKIVPKDIPLTSFSILFARYRGDFDITKVGTTRINSLRDNSKILIAEGCTHHKQCDDIGTVKLPNMLKSYTKKELLFDFVSGTEFPDDLSEYDLIIHCGACMLNRREMKYRLEQAITQQVPITNYGMAIAYMLGIFDQGVAIFE